MHFLESAERISLPLDGYRLKRAFTDLAYTAEGELEIEGRPVASGAFLLERICTARRAASPLTESFVKMGSGIDFCRLSPYNRGEVT